MSDNPYALHSTPSAEPPPATLAGARALMRHRLFALMHAAVVVLLLVILGTILRSGGLSSSTTLPVLGMVSLTVFMATTCIMALRAKPLSLPLGVLADLACLCTCIFAAPAIWSLVLRFRSNTIHQALLNPPPLSAWSPHWPTVFFLPIVTVLNLTIPLFLAVGLAL